MAFVDAYSTLTGRKTRVPEHFIGHPVLGRNLSLTPSAKAAAAEPVNSPEHGQADRSTSTDVSTDTDEPLEDGLPDGDPTDQWTVPELEKYAADHDIDLAGATRKADVLDAINTHLQSTTEHTKSPAAGEGQE